MCLPFRGDFVDTKLQEWQGVPGVDGAEWQVWQEDPRTGGIQALREVPPGAIEPSHHHTHGHWILRPGWSQEGGEPHAGD